MGTRFWKMPFRSVASSRQLVEFYVIDLRILPGREHGKLQLADATVCLASEIGQGREWITKTHLGHQLRPGDSAMGYLCSALNSNHEEFAQYMNSSKAQTDVILVHKFYPDYAARRRRRKWKLRSLRKEKTTGNPEEHQEELDEFMDDLERDQEYRKDVQIFMRSRQADVPPENQNVELDEEEDLSICSDIEALKIDEEDMP